MIDPSTLYKAAQLWNLLPADAKDFQSLDKFKISLSTLLRKFPDNPPVTGYSTANHNSLLDWSNQSGGLLVDFTHPYIDDIWVGEIRQLTSETNSEKGDKSNGSLFFLFDHVQNHQNSTFHETETCHQIRRH